MRSTPLLQGDRSLVVRQRNQVSCDRQLGEHTGGQSSFLRHQERLYQESEPFVFERIRWLIDTDRVWREKVCLSPPPFRDLIILYGTVQGEQLQRILFCSVSPGRLPVPAPIVCLQTGYPVRVLVSRAALTKNRKLDSFRQQKFILIVLEVHTQGSGGPWSLQDGESSPRLSLASGGGCQPWRSLLAPAPLQCLPLWLHAPLCVSFPFLRGHQSY